MLRKLLISVLSLVILSSCETIFIGLSGEKPRIEIKGEKAYVNDVLGKRFYKQFSEFVVAHPHIKTLILEDVPGSANDEWNVKSCLLLHKKGISTELTSTSVIASGGVDLFISGTKRSIEEGAKIGVHSWSDGKKDGWEYPKDAQEHQLFLNLFRQIEVDREIRKTLIRRNFQFCLYGNRTYF